MDTVYRKRLAFLGDAVLKSDVVKYLVARQGLQWPDLCRHTEYFVSNASLSVVFEKLQLQKAIDSYVLKSGITSVHNKATYIEALLGSTEMLAPKQTCKVVAKVINLLKGTLPRPLPLEPLLFEMKLAKSATTKKPCRLSCADTLRSRAASKAPTADHGEESTSKSKAKALAFSLKTASRSKTCELHQSPARAATQQKPTTIVKQFSSGINNVNATVSMLKKPPSNVNRNNVDSVIRHQAASYFVVVRRKAPMLLCGGVRKTVKKNTHLLFLSP